MRGRDPAGRRRAGRDDAALPALPGRGAARRARRRCCCSTRRPLAFGAVAGRLIGTVGSPPSGAGRTCGCRCRGRLAAARGDLRACSPASAAACSAPSSAARSRPRAVPARRARSSSRSPGCWSPASPSAWRPPTGGHQRAGARSSVRAGPRRSTPVKLNPPTAAEDAAWFRPPPGRAAGSWSTGSRRCAPGVYRTAEPMPVHGEWKTLLRLHRATRWAACRSTCPRTRRSRPRRSPRRASFERAFVLDKEILQREAKEGVAGLTLLGYGIVLGDHAVRSSRSTPGRSCASRR